MAASVQVLCPNGRRQNVKINPNTKLLQILEEVCQRQGFLPPEDYKLVQGRKELDLSLSVRFSSLPNNAKLELAKSTSSRVEQDVTIALQLDSGRRLQDSFNPSANLWDILQHFESKESEFKGVLTRVDTSQIPALHPVCIFMREEVTSEPALKATTLKKLALTSGKAIIRLLHRPVEEKVVNEIVGKIEKERQKQVKLEEMAVKKNEIRQMDEMERNRSLDTSLSNVPEEKSETLPRATDDTQVSSPSLQSETSSAKPVDSSSSGKGQMEPVDGGAEDSVSTSTPSESAAGKPRSQQTSLKKPPQPEPTQERQGQNEDHLEDLRRLGIPGMEIFTPDDFNNLGPAEQAVARRLAVRFLSHLQLDPNTSATASFSEEEESFADFRFPESTRGMDLTGQGLHESQPENRRPCEREALVFDSEEPIAQKNADNKEGEDIPDDFFEVTQADVRIMYKDLQNAVQQMEDQPLITKKMKRDRIEALYDKYEKVVIRVRFPDKLTLQGFFQPREPVSALFKFVKDNMADQRLGFYLYTTPPKEMLKDNSISLSANHLAPAALVHFGSSSKKESFLREDLKRNLRPRLEAEALVTRVLKPSIDDTETPTYGQNTASGSGSTSQAGASAPPRRAASNTSSSLSSSRSTLPSGTPVPKWLKLSKK